MKIRFSLDNGGGGELEFLDANVAQRFLTRLIKSDGVLPNVKWWTAHHPNVSISSPWIANEKRVRALSITFFEASQ